MAERPSKRFGERLAYYRKLAGLSGEALARRVPSITRSVIANIENGRKRDISIDDVIALAWALDIPPVALALPLDRPQTFVSTGGGGATTTYARAYDLIEWFKTGRRASGHAHSPANAIANLRIAKLEDFLNTMGHIRQAEARLKRGDTKSDWVAILQEETARRDELLEELRGLGVEIDPGGGGAMTEAEASSSRSLREDDPADMSAPRETPNIQMDIRDEVEPRGRTISVKGRTGEEIPAKGRKVYEASWKGLERGDD